ncbi:response regulator [Pontibacterium sp. N1Y112]|uniref:Response regulator n=1 Tax=Pontibacterium sinense TaxID=2781979 RepID=A0A8J7FL12_9GAMM|nr:response regulator [Pontibacterium sinense]MBE9398173.1 response regulator [Pontibacterium sinense]
MRLLLIEDDPLLGQGIMLALQARNYRVDWQQTGSAGLQVMQHDSAGVVILDLNLPDMDGLEVLQQARQQGIATPVLILTARDAIEERITGLDKGADDYLVKPFDLDELEARIRALHRRASGRDQEYIEHGDLTINTAAREVKFQNHSMTLGRREYDLLLSLLNAKGRVLTRRQIEEEIYEDDPESNALEVHIHALRKKFGKSLIRTVRGVGYMVEN